MGLCSYWREQPEQSPCQSPGLLSRAGFLAWANSNSQSARAIAQILRPQHPVYLYIHKLAEADVMLAHAAFVGHAHFL